MTSTAGTLCAAAELLKKEGAAKIYAAVSHNLLNEVGRERITNSCIEELITTDGVPCDDCNGKLKVLSIAPLLGRAIKRIHAGESVSSLFQVQA
jgi:ribose-phosphate pyrophosphokinase